MAIVKTTFTGTTLADNAPEVLSYLQTNATDYFDSITADEGGNVSCIIDGVTVLYLGFDGTAVTSISLANGTSVSATDSGTTYYTKAYKTSNGIMLVDAGGRNIVICKSNHDTTSIIACIRSGSISSTSHYLYFGDIANNATWYHPLSSKSTAKYVRDSYVMVYAAEFTSLTNVILGDGGTLAKNVYMTSPYTEREASAAGSPNIIVQQLTINNKNYLYDGLIAIED